MNGLTAPRTAVTRPQEAEPGGEVPYRGTSPWGEAPPWDALGVDDIHPDAIIGPHDDDIIHRRINLAFGREALPLEWNADDQLHGTAVPPGAPNDQDFQSGHTSILVHNPSSEQGWGMDPAFTWPRYPHMQGNFPEYATGIYRRNGQLQVDKNPWAYQVLRQRQLRDLALRTALVHRVHEAVVAKAPSVANTVNVHPVQWPSPEYDTFPFDHAGVPPD